MPNVKIVRELKALSSEVFDYFTNSTSLRDWLCDIATTNPHPEGRLYMSWAAGYYTSGEYLEVNKDKSVSFTWLGRGEPHPTRVGIVLKKKRGGTQLKLTHRGLGRGDKWATIAKTYEKEWQSALDNLASVLEHGPDLRITRRPMIGINVGLYNAEIAMDLGIPADYGLRVDGVIDGMGAQKAGLGADDVIVGVDGVELSAVRPFSSVISTKHTGDVVEIAYYRGGEKRSVRMTLSGRPIPPIPASAAELGKQLEPAYRQIETEIETLLKSVTDAECGLKPAGDEWSVKDVLAHLIHSEIGWQNNMGEIISGYEGTYDDFGGNVQARIDGTVAVFPTKAELLAQLKLHDNETLVMIAHIPEEFLAHKGKFWKLVFQANDNQYHIQAHLEQIQDAIRATRKKQPENG